MIINSRRPDDAFPLDILTYIGAIRLMALTVQKLPCSQTRRGTLDVKYLDGERPPEGGTMDSAPRIVIVEDETITALHLAKQLRSLGYQVVAQASSGPQAVQRVFSFHPHAVLMNVHVHGPMDGVGAARHI